MSEILIRLFKMLILLPVLAIVAGYMLFFIIVLIKSAIDYFKDKFSYGN